MPPERHSALPRNNTNPTTDTSKDAHEAVIEVSQPVIYSKILPHTAEAGDPYYIGDAYAEYPLDISREWEINRAWPSLRYLADFMEVSTSPVRWKFLRENEAERKDRCHRTNIAILDFDLSGNSTCKRLTNADDLQAELRREGNVNPDTSSLRLLVVEDLSRGVIEMLGSKFDIDSTLFRSHIDDYSWYNIRDRWMEPPTLRARKKHQNWTQVRFVRPRYFKTGESFQTGRDESNRFNVFRRPDDDQNQWPYMDGDAVVGITRTKISVWVSKDDSPGSGITGIVLVDPTVKEGFPLWHGYQNWAPIPGMHEAALPPSGAPRMSLFEDVIHLMSKYPWPPSLPQATCLQNLRPFMQPILYLTCAEWLIICQYIKSRLGQIEWELSNPGEFYKDTQIIDKSLERLHTWRRHIPFYREILTETLRSAGPPEDLRHPNTTDNRESCQAHKSTGDSSHHDLAQMIFSEDITPDIEEVIEQMGELQERTDRLTTMVVAAISIADSHRSLEESSNVARLTWLATIFIPLSFITGLFSMQEDIAKLQVTFGWYFACAIPVTVVTLSIVVIAKSQVARNAGSSKKA
ncbi:metal ion transmembrane transporter [Fusarium circinatum]|uniref:Metal ion transmembrane transporter n=1 Tax=Fusarium circinatum TaxID=48490 RepID=A0A8H5SXZ7_FUSCI|nr:metal ion transmembrane transporter [Fusarium circinatum]